MLITILFTALTAGAVKPDVYRPDKCQVHLSAGNIRRLERALTPLLPNGQGPLKPERKRLRELVVAHVAGYIRALDPARREHFFTTLEHVRSGVHTGVRDGRVYVTDDDTIEVSYDDRTGLYLHVGANIGRSLLGVLQVVHELRHLSRVVSDDPSVEAQIAAFKAQAERWLGVYREEILAAFEEYRFLRWAISPPQLVKIERVVESEDRGSALFMANIEFVTCARRALLSTRREYVRAAVPLDEYQELQRQFARKRARRRYVDRVGTVSPWLARALDRTSQFIIQRLERPDLITKDSSSR